MRAGTRRRSPRPLLAPYQHRSMRVSAPVALAVVVLAALAIAPGTQTRAAAAASSTGTLIGAIINLTPDSRSGPLPGTVELLTGHGRLAASQRVRVGHSFRVVVAAGRYRLTSTVPCSWSTVVVIHAGQIVHDNVVLSDCGP
jgi:hypothetical protein